MPQRKAARKRASAGIPAPRPWRNEIAQVLLEPDRIHTRVTRLAARIQRDYRGQDLVIVALLNGTVLFLADLIRHLTLPLRLDFIGVSSYGAGTTSGQLVFTKELRVDVKGRHVLVVDDILDTGRTMSRVIGKLQALGPRSIKTCVFLEKKARRKVELEPDYVGFQIPDYFVVGYGLDYAERYRNLPFVGVLHEHIYAPPDQKTTE